ncbi:hypothetical protein C8R46DRAFT_254264 [Mycena filopes]|nr:hypothetical protein C8R46DRAFT_254264 [Mycena filopes]
MPAVAQLPGEARCYRCDKLGDLRRCSRCQIARYCSPECQRADWKDHKPRCQDVQDDMQDDEPMEKELKVFRKWTAAWTDSLLSWALFAANLANQPSDYLLTNSFYIIIERQPQAPKGVLAKYRVYWGGMSPDTVILDHLKKIPDAGYREQTTGQLSTAPADAGYPAHHRRPSRTMDVQFYEAVHYPDIPGTTRAWAAECVDGSIECRQPTLVDRTPSRLGERVCSAYSERK